MDPSSEPVGELGLFARAQSGDQAAWVALFNECYPKVQRVVRRRINGPLRRYVDSTDIASDVFGELAEKASRFRFETVDDVRNFLLDAAHKRVVDEHRRFLAKKRDSRREMPLGAGGTGVDAWGISSGEPTPSQHAVAQETDEKLRSATSDEKGRRVIELRREHHNNEEISELTGWSLRKVQRFLERLRPIFLN
ncbi:MAG TPA: ECF-type sigma factor [Isosphaeraceae bacterium]|jgi:RNA polymerase sigma factor (sigma-70 family)